MVLFVLIRLYRMHHPVKSTKGAIKATPAMILGCWRTSSICIDPWESTNVNGVAEGVSDGVMDSVLDGVSVELLTWTQSLREKPC